MKILIFMLCIALFPLFIQGFIAVCVVGIMAAAYLYTLIAERMNNAK